MSKKEKFNNQADTVLYFVHVYRLRYIQLDELKTEFPLMIEERFIDIINH